MKKPILDPDRLFAVKSIIEDVDILITGENTGDASPQINKIFKRRVMEYRV